MRCGSATQNYAGTPERNGEAKMERRGTAGIGWGERELRWEKKRERLTGQDRQVQGNKEHSDRKGAGRGAF